MTHWKVKIANSGVTSPMGIFNKFIQRRPSFHPPHTTHIQTASFFLSSTLNLTDLTARDANDTVCIFHPNILIKGDGYGIISTCGLLCSKSAAHAILFANSYTVPGSTLPISHSVCMTKNRDAEPWSFECPFAYSSRPVLQHVRLYTYLMHPRHPEFSAFAMAIQYF